MIMDTEILALEKICLDVSKTKRLSKPQICRLKDLFGNRFENAWKAVNENRVKRYVFYPSERVVWIVVGKERDYQVIPVANYCSCDDFYFRVIDGLTPLCYHIIAQKFAGALDLYELYEESDELYRALMNEWREFRE